MIGSIRDVYTSISVYVPAQCNLHVVCTYANNTSDTMFNNNIHVHTVYNAEALILLVNIKIVS